MNHQNEYERLAYLMIDQNLENLVHVCEMVVGIVGNRTVVRAVDIVGNRTVVRAVDIYRFEISYLTQIEFTLSDQP